MNGMNRHARASWGVFASGGFTVLVFAVGPLLAMTWWLTGADPIVDVVAPMVGDELPPVMLDIASITALEGPDVSGEGGTEDGPLEAGPNPTEASDGDGSTDALVDTESGDEGEDAETSQEVQGIAARSKGPSSVTRTARGVRTPGVKGYAELAATYRSGAKRRRGRNRCPESHPDVKDSGQEKWLVNRNLVEYYTKSIKRFNSLGWSGPFQNDEYRGWRIGGFGCKSPLYHAGLRRGDIVLTVNSKPTRTWLQVFGAYTKLKRKDDFEIVLIRRGKRKVLRYHLYEGGPPTPTG